LNSATGPLVTKSVTQFDPFMVDVTDLYVLVGDGTNSQIVKYTFVRAGTTITRNES